MKGVMYRLVKQWQQFVGLMRNSSFTSFLKTPDVF